jgi:hypothetical protein
MIHDFSFSFVIRGILEYPLKDLKKTNSIQISGKEGEKEKCGKNILSQTGL